MSAAFDESGRYLTAHEHAASMIPGRSGPLADVRIVDLTQALAGPFCTMILADMGADVIKVEPPHGDSVRVIGPYTEADEDHFFGGYFASNNRNKRSVVLDLKEPDGAEAFLRLVETADVVVENYRAGVMDQLGLGYEVLRERRPGLVYGAIRGFGDPRTGEGPYTYWPAYDIVAQSMSGLISYTGTEDGIRVASGPSVGDLYPAAMMVSGILAALHHARRTGEGQFVDVGMVDALMALCESMTWRYTYTGEIQAPRGSEHPSLCPFELYDTADGQVAIAAPGPRHWERLCRIIGREDMIDHDRYKSARRRVLHRDEVREAITAWTGGRTKAEVVDALADQVPCGPVNNAADLAGNEQVKARKMLVAVDHPGSARPVVTPNTPIRFAESPTGVYRPAPKLGEHTDEVMAELKAAELKSKESQ
ncbi:MAG: CoA transferase [bacterium]|nr:CoA transferase [bacterium]MCY4273305.1 CoA transferase [bacterium]